MLFTNKRLSQTNAFSQKTLFTKNAKDSKMNFLRTKNPPLKSILDSNLDSKIESKNATFCGENYGEICGKNRYENFLAKSLAFFGFVFFISQINQVCSAKDLPLLLPSKALPSYMLQKKHSTPKSTSKPASYSQCASCHGNNGNKRPPGSRGNTTIAGLPKYKIIGDLRAYKHKIGNKGGTNPIMQEQAQNLSERDIQALAEYISKLPKSN